MGIEAELLVVYDSDCGVCERFRGFVEDRDLHGKVQFVSRFEKSLYKKYPQILPADCEKAIQVVEQGGRVCSGGDGVLQILKKLPRYAAWGHIFDRFPFRFFVNLFYRIFAANRKVFSKVCGLEKKR